MELVLAALQNLFSQMDSPLHGEILDQAAQELILALVGEAFITNRR
jgi:hypothetical protein